MKNYIIGYGSLINVESQNITGKSLSSIPAILNGYSRSWTVTYDHLKFCALGVYENPAHKINVVIFEAEDLAVFDAREHGYTRIEISTSQLTAWDKSFPVPTDGKIWIYLPYAEKFGQASDRHYIWQSYVDVILMGCISISSSFAEEFMNSTQGWDLRFFNDDRKTSTYLTALKTYDVLAIDNVLKSLK